MTAPAIHPLAARPESDADVVMVVLGGADGAFEILMRRHNQRVFRAARAVLRDDQDAEDAAQQAWLQAYRHLASWTGRGPFSAWVTRIAVREATRRARRRALVPLRDVGRSEMASTAPSPEVEAARAHLRALIESAIDDLPPTLRAVLVLRDVDGMSGAETAAALGLSAEASRVRLHRARRLLRHRLDEQLDERVGEAFPFLGRRCDVIVGRVLGALRAS